jgi:retron-type reverse transcriptase
MHQLELFTKTENLFEQLTETGTLRSGFKAVKRNGGSPGVDDISIKEYGSRLDEELDQLTAELLSWSYKPKPVRRVEIPKPGGGVRLLGVPCIRDRVVQASLKLLLELKPHVSTKHSCPFLTQTFQTQAMVFDQSVVRK